MCDPCVCDPCVCVCVCVCVCDCVCVCVIVCVCDCVCVCVCVIVCVCVCVCVRTRARIHLIFCLYAHMQNDATQTGVRCYGLQLPRPLLPAVRSVAGRAAPGPDATTAL